MTFDIYLYLYLSMDLCVHSTARDAVSQPRKSTTLALILGGPVALTSGSHSVVHRSILTGSRRRCFSSRYPLEGSNKHYILYIPLSSSSDKLLRVNPNKWPWHSSPRTNYRKPYFPLFYLWLFCNVLTYNIRNVGVTKIDESSLISPDWRIHEVDQRR